MLSRPGTPPPPPVTSRSEGARPMAGGATELRRPATAFGLDVDSELVKRF